MPSPFFSGRIPQKLYERAESYCKESGDSKTELLIKALANYLDYPIKFPRNVDFTEQEVTKEEFNLLVDRVKNLETFLNPAKNVIINDNSKITPDITNKNELESSSNATENKVIRIKDLSDITEMQPQQKINLKNQAFKKASKKGYEILENINFIPPIEITYKKGIFIEGKEYEIFCEGIDENLKPIWLLKINDNSSYQLNITGE